MSTSVRTRHLPWYRRLETRVVAGTILLVSLSLAVVLTTTARSVTSHSLERTAGDLDAARAAFDRLADDRAAFAGAQTALVTSLPIFLSHMTDPRLAADAATLQVMAEDYRQRLKADFAVVTNREGTWTAAAGWPDGVAAPDGLRALVTGATSGRSAHDVFPVRDRLFLVVSEPGRFAEEVLGTFTVGYALDDAVAKRVAEETHCDVNMVWGDRLYASSLPSADREVLRALIAGRTWQPGQRSRAVEHIGEHDYAVGAFGLSTVATGAAGGAGRLVLLKDWQPTRDFLAALRNELLATGAAIFVVALLGAVALSRRMTRPLMDLADAAEDIAGGNWNRQIPARGSAEATTMALAFNQMTTSLRHWYEHAKKRDDELRQAQKLEAIGRLAGGVAHDFNNMLTAIKGYGELLFGSLEEGDDRRSDAEEIIKAADRAASLTKQLLAFSRRQVVTPRILRLDRVVLGTEQMLRRLIGEQVELITAVATDTGLVRADPTQIEQILLNLAVNARDAMPEGGTVRIELADASFAEAPGQGHSTLPPGRYVRLSVVDTGEGMTPETLTHIFEPFYTTKEEGRGTGLGLATVHGIVEQSGGAIDVTSEPSRGTAFHIYLPCATDGSTPTEDEASELVDGPIGGSETVLLVEDDTRVATLVASALRKAGYTVLEAPDARRAIDIVSRHQGAIDLLLTDVVMPGMNGRELAEYVTLALPGTRVLYMSGYSDDAVLQRGIETATANFLQKPFSMEALARKVRQVLMYRDAPAM